MGYAKRSQDVDGRDPKKPRRESNAMLSEVVQAVESAAKRQGISESARIVLQEMAKGGLATPAQERHAFQEEAIDRVFAVLQQQQDALEQDVSAAESKVSDLDEEKSSLGARTTNAEAELQQKKAATQDEKVALAEATHAVLRIRASVADAEAAQRKGDMDKVRILESKSEAEAVLSQRLAPLKTSSCGADPRAIAVHLSPLLALAKKMDVDESLVSALTNAANQPAANRKPFDLVVFDQFEQVILDNIASMRTELEAMELRASEREADAAQTRQESAATRTAQVQAAKSFRAAQAAEQEAAASMAAFQRRAGELGQDRADAVEACDQRRDVLENYRSWTLACFETLRDRPSKTRPTDAGVDREKESESPELQRKNMVEEGCSEAAAVPALAYGGQ